MRRCLPSHLLQPAAENEPPQTRPVVATGAIVGEQLAPLLDELEKLLEIGSMQVVETSAVIMGMALSSPSIDRFRYHVKRLDSDGALGCLEEIKREFGMPIENTAG